MKLAAIAVQPNISGASGLNQVPVQMLLGLPVVDYSWCHRWNSTGPCLGFQYFRWRLGHPVLFQNDIPSTGMIRPSRNRWFQKVLVTHELVGTVAPWLAVKLGRRQAVSVDRIVDIRAKFRWQGCSGRNGYDGGTRERWRFVLHWCRQAIRQKDHSKVKSAYWFPVPMAAEIRRWLFHHLQSHRCR